MPAVVQAAARWRAPARADGRRGRTDPPARAPRALRRAAGGPVRPRGRRARARLAGFLRRLPPRAHRRRLPHRQPVRPPLELRALAGEPVRGLRSGRGVGLQAHARRQHGGAGTAPRLASLAAGAAGARRGGAAALGPAGREVDALIQTRRRLIHEDHHRRRTARHALRPARLAARASLADGGQRDQRGRGAPHRGAHCVGPQRAAPAAAPGRGGHGARGRRPRARRRGADAMARAALRAHVSAHRSAEGGGWQGGRRDERGLRGAPQGAARAGGPGRGGGGHGRTLPHRLGGRGGAPDPQDRAPGAVQPGRDHALHGRVLRTREIRARRDEERRQRRLPELRATGGVGQGQQADRCQRPGRGAGGGLAVAIRLRPARQRHPPGASPRAGRDPLPHRRRAAPGVPVAAGRDERDDGAHQAAGPHGRGGAPPPAGRAHQDAQTRRRRRQGGRGRDAPVHAAHGLRRKAGDAHLRSRVDGEGPGSAGLRRARRRALGRPHAPPARHRARHRPHGLGQDDHAVRHAQAPGHGRGEREHGGGPDRDDRAGLQPDAGAAAPGPGLRAGTARADAAGPGHHHGGRDP